jgi:hypothetical protein
MTAICFSIGGMFMVMVTGGAAMYGVIKMYYFLKVQQERMELQAGAEIRSLTKNALRLNDEELERMGR